MKKIYKYKLGMDGEIVDIKAPIVKFLNVKFQPGEGIVIWAEVDDAYDEVETQIIAIGTGWDIPEQIAHWNYLGTELDGYGYVWHYYCRPFTTSLKNEIKLKDLLEGQFYGNSREWFDCGR